MTTFRFFHHERSALICHPERSSLLDNSAGTVVKYAYDAFGNCKVLLDTAGLSTVNPIRYRGYYYDHETKLYYLNARYYNPEWRRFISPDDTAYLDPENPNGLNFYAYCNNDPVGFVDIAGCFPLPIEIVTNMVSGFLDLYEALLKSSLASLKKTPKMTMEIAKKVARKGGHLLSARQIMRNQQKVVSATRNSIDDFAKAGKILGKALLVADIAWSVGENILGGEESWVSDTLVDVGISLAIYGLSFLPGGVIISLAATAITFIWEDQIEEFKDAFYKEWDSFWNLILA